MRKLKVNMISESTFTVQGHGVHTAFLEMTRALKARDDVEVVVNKFRSGADITHIQTIGFYSLLHLFFGSGKKVISVHVVPDSLVGSLIGAKRFYKTLTRYMRIFYGRADLLLAVSKTVQQTLQRDLHIKKPIELIYNTVDMSLYRTTLQDKLAARQRIGVPGNAKVVVGSAQIQPRKRFDIFCQMAKAMPNATFIWVGGIPFKRLGADYTKMQKMLDAKPQNVTITGVLEHNAVKKYLQAADVFFLPSQQENHPMSLLEAAGVGLPIIVRDIPEYDDTFKNDVLRGTDDTFLELLQRLFSDKEFYKQAQRGSADIAARFDSRAGGDRLMQCYYKVLGWNKK